MSGFMIDGCAKCLFIIYAARERRLMANKMIFNKLC